MSPKNMALVTLTALFLSLGGLHSSGQAAITWTTGVIDGSQTDNKYVSVAYDPAGVFSTAYRIEDRIEVRTYAGGTTWNAVRAFDATDSALLESLSDDVSLAIDSGSNFHIAFRGSRNVAAGSGSTRGVFYAYIPADGSSVTIEEIDTYSNPNGWLNTDDPKIALSSTGIPYVIYSFADANNLDAVPNRLYQIRGAVRSTATPTAGTWTDAVVRNLVGASHAEESTPDLILDSADNVHLCFMENIGIGSGDDDNIWYGFKPAASAFNEANITFTKIGDEPATGLFDPRIALDPSGNVFVSFAGGAADLFLTNNTGGTFNTPVVVDAGDVGGNAELSINASNNKVIGHQDYNTDDVRLTYQLGAAPFVSEPVYATADIAGNRMSSQVNDAGQVMFVFENRDGSNFKQVRFAFGTLPGGVAPPPPIPPAPTAKNGFIRLRKVAGAKSGTLVVAAAVDFGDGSVDLSQAATIESGTQTKTLAAGDLVERRPGLWFWQSGDKKQRLIIREPRGDMSSGILSFRKKSNSDTLGGTDDFHFRFLSGTFDVGADVEVDAGGRYRAGRAPGTNAPVAVVRIAAKIPPGADNDTFNLTAQFASDMVIPATAPDITIRIGEPGSAFEMRVPNADSVATPWAGRGFRYRVPDPDGTGPLKPEGLWFVSIDYTRRTIRAFGHNVDLGAFTVPSSAPVYVSVGVGATEDAVELRAAAWNPGLERLLYR